MSSVRLQPYGNLATLQSYINSSKTTGIRLEMAHWGGLMFIVVCCVGMATADNNTARYDHYTVYRVRAETPQQLKQIQGLDDNNIVEFWGEARRVGESATVMVPPHNRAVFNDFVKNNNMTYTLSIPDVQKRFDKERKTMRALAARRAGKGFDWNNYYSLEDIYNWLRDLERMNSNIKVVQAGKTYEGREILGIEITNGAQLPGVVMEAGIHAREWISPAASSYVLNEIIKSPADSIFKKFNYMYIPVANPDGYEYTRNSDRAWRKNRRPIDAGNGITCYGTDLNRNWGLKWGVAGVSKEPCSTIYAGPSAFSEIETKSLSEFYTNISKRYDIYLDFHCFTQKIMYPWGYSGVDTGMGEQWKRIATKAANAMEAVHGTKMTVGSIYDTIYPAAGSSLDWYFGVFRNTMSFIFELRDTGKYGFVLPPEQIIPSGEELIPAVKTILEEYKGLKKWMGNKKNSKRSG